LVFFLVGEAGGPHVGDTSFYTLPSEGECSEREA